MRLYCIPHAGATASIYRPWQAVGAPELRIIGVDPPGRGSRAREPKIRDYPELVRSMAEPVVADLARCPSARYATFGHSFGAMVSLSVAAAVAGATGRKPVCAILSAGLPPRLLSGRADGTATLTDDELLAKAVRDGGMSPGLLANRTMTEYLVRLLREDHAVRRQFARHGGIRVDFPLILVAASADAHISPDQMWQWSEHTSAACHRVEIPGDHFAAIREPKEIIALVREGAPA